MKDIYQVIRNVRLSEKASLLQETNNEVTLEVDRKANKIEIKQAVEGLFQVKVKAINPVTVKGKTKVFRGRPGVRSDWKKAIVSLVDGHKIDVTTGL